MSALTDYFPIVRSWVDDANPSDTLIESWIRLAEERINNELRSKEQITVDYATMDDNCVVLPADWLEHVYVRVQGGKPFHYVTPDTYWTMAAGPTRPLQVVDPTNPPTWPGCPDDMVYTTIGTTLFVLPPINPDNLTKVEIGYFRAIVPLGTDMDPVMVRYPSILLNCTLAAGAPYLIEDERLQTFATLATAGIVKANQAAEAARWSGSPLTPRVRSFG